MIDFSLFFPSFSLNSISKGDASSPHGATCIYQINGDGNTITAINSKSPSPSSPNGTTTLTATTTNNEGLTRQQLDLISQIMQQTKQANGQRSNTTTTTVQRPRTWNMQVKHSFQHPFSIFRTLLDSLMLSLESCYKIRLKSFNWDT